MDGTSTDNRDYRDEPGWYGNTNRTYEDGSKEHRSQGWYGRTNWKDSSGNHGTEFSKNGTTYRTDQEGNWSKRND